MREHYDDAANYQKVKNHKEFERIRDYYDNMVKEQIEIMKNEGND